MTEKELEEIISLKDRDGILAELKSRGFREVGTDGEFEFDSEIISKESAYQKDITLQDTPARRQYQIYLFKDNKTYKGITFILFKVFAILPDINKTVPRTMLLFTDAPHDAEYELRISSPYACDRCKKEYIKKDMFIFGTDLLCDDCLTQTIKEECPNF